MNEEEASLWHRLIDAQVQVLHMWGDILHRMADVLQREHDIVECKYRLLKIQLSREMRAYELKAAREDP